MIFTVRQARVCAGITQVEMAEKLGIPINNYRRREINPELMSVHTARRFADIVGLPIDQIFFSKGLPKVEPSQADTAPPRPA